jgi:hypothetical protein
VDKDLKLTLWCVDSGLSYSCFETKKAKAFFSALNYEVPSAKEIRKMVDVAEVLLVFFYHFLLTAVQSLCCDELKAQLKGLPSIAFTSDGWSDDRYRRYISLTGHWVINFLFHM